MDPQTANGAYGFASWTPAAPGGVATIAETHVGVTGNVPGAVLPKLPLIGDNPLLWLLALLLIWTGYIYGAFDVGVKKIGRTSIKIGG